jgi:hypothetical protein
LARQTRPELEDQLTFKTFGFQVLRLWRGIAKSTPIFQHEVASEYRFKLDAEYRFKLDAIRPKNIFSGSKDHDLIAHKLASLSYVTKAGFLRFDCRSSKTISFN